MASERDPLSILSVEAVMAFMIALTLAVVVGALLGMSVSGIASQAEEAYRRMRGGARDRRGRGLGTYELAFLAGGPLRVVNTGLAALLGTGRLRLSRGGVLHRVAGADPGEYDVERALLDAVDRHGGRLGVPEARREVSAGREVEAVRHRLQGMALLAGDDQLAQVRTLLRRLRRWSWVTMGVAVASALAGVPVAQLSGEVAFVLFGAAGVFVVMGARGVRLHRRKRAVMDNLLTYAGRERLLEARDAYAVREGRLEARDAYAEGGGRILAFAPVAVFGLEHLDDARVVAELKRVQDGSAGCGAGACGGGTGEDRTVFGLGTDPAGDGGGDFGSGGDGGGSGCGGGGCGGCGG
ncbi:hypothetical protein GCM10023096_50260 [Nonomuraea ferruginea]